MRKSDLIITLIIGLLPMFVQGQLPATTPIQQKLDSLKTVVQQTIGDNQVIVGLKEITQLYFTGFYQLDSAKKYANQLREASIQLQNPRGIALSNYYLGRVADGKGDYKEAIRYSLQFLESDVVKSDTSLLANGWYTLANIYIHQGNLEEAINYQLRVLRLDEASGNQSNIGLSLNNMGIIMKELNRTEEAIQYLERTLSIFANLSDKGNIAMALSNLGGLYSTRGDKRRALQTFERSLILYQELQNDRGIALAYQHLGSVERSLNQYQNALNHIRKSIEILQGISLKKEISESYHEMALTFNDLEENDSVRFYLFKSLQLAQDVGDKKIIRSSYRELSDLEAKEGNFKQAYENFQSFHLVSDSIFNESTANRIGQLETQYEIDKQEAEILNLKTKQELNDRNNKTLRWALIASAFLTMLIVFFLTYRVRINRKLLLLEQTQNRKVEKAYSELKNTQAQLIQTEKMASLGELTAGIAHEIQNPLNFVNNFSEVSEELGSELREELNHGDVEEAKAITDDIVQNLIKINHHGKRASEIVQSMLQHSRTSTGQRELTDINALADEYLRLAYHGFRAKDRSFNADFKTEFDPNLPNIKVVPQDLGRVILNLINNGFQALEEKTKSGIEGYKPALIIRTKNLGDKIEISIIDNGPGIPESIKDKIFQPFFTTKDTGKGTGLGLSLAYDLIKSYGGTLEVVSEMGQGSTFKIALQK